MHLSHLPEDIRLPDPVHDHAMPGCDVRLLRTRRNDADPAPSWLRDLLARPGAAGEDGRSDDGSGTG